MEPVSLAVGVVPLAMNIVQMAATIREKISTYKSAHKDIKAVLDKTARIGLICRSLEVDLDSHDSDTGPFPGCGLKCLRDILADCYSNMANVHETLSKIVVDEPRNKVLLNPVSTQYLMKKGKIDKCLTDLDSSLSMLDLYVTSSTWMLLRQAQIFPRTQVPSQSLTLVNQYSSPSLTSDAIGRRFSATVSGRNVKWTRQEASWNSKGWFYLSKTALSSETELGDGVTEKHQSYLVGSPLVSLYAKLAIRRGTLNPLSLSLELPQVINQLVDPMRYEKIISSMPYRAKDMPYWLRENSIPPNTQLISRHGTQTSLLGVAVCFNHPETFTFLLEFARCQLDHEPQFCRSSRSLRRMPLPCTETDCSDRYIDLRGPFLTLEEFEAQLNFGQHPSFFDNVFDKCKEIFIDQWDSFITRSWRVLVSKAVPRSDSYYVRDDDRPLCDPINWKSSMSRLLAASVDIHRCFYSERGYLTALGSILRDSDLAFDALNRGYSWLEILEKCGVDIDAYLRREWELNMHQILLEEGHTFDYIPGLGRWAQLEEILRLLRGLGSVWGDPHPSGGLGSKTETSDLIQAMPHLSYGPLIWSHPLPDDENCHKAWKQHYQLKRSEVYSWPVTKLIERGDAPWYYLNNFYATKEDEGWLMAFEKACHLVETRFERRQVNKWRKLQKKRGLTGQNKQQMPGAWQEEWWETPMAF